MTVKISSPAPAVIPSKQLGAVLLLYSPILIAVLLMLPRLSQPNFGLFDDGRTLVISHDINQGIWDMSWDSAAGRFRPVYWLYYAFLYRLSGMNALGFFIGNTLILAGTVAALIALARLTGLSRLQAWLAGMFFLLSGPVVENFYTLSKAEPLQLLAISVALVLGAQSARIRHHLGQSLLLVGCFLCFLLAYLVKETTLVVIPISAAWILLAWVRSLRNKKMTGTQPRFAVLASSILAGGVFFITRRLAVPVSLTGGSYSDQYLLTTERILASIIRWSGWLIRDFAYLAPMAVGLFLLWLILRREPSLRSGNQHGFRQAHLLLEALIWMAAWIVVYLPWVYMQEYYALPFAAGAALGAGLVFGWLVNALKMQRLSGRVLIIAAIAGTCLLWLVTLPNNLSNARIQVAVDDANAHMLAQVAEYAPLGSTVLVNIQTSNEYVEQMALYYLPEVFGRTDLTTHAYQSQPLGVGSELYRPNVILAVPHIENQPLMAVRMGLYEPTQDSWNGSLLGQLAAGWKMQNSIDNQVPLFLVDLPRVFCPFIRTRLFCAVPSPLLDQRQFSYGWDLYQIQP